MSSIGQFRFYINIKRGITRKLNFVYSKSRQTSHKRFLMKKNLSRENRDKKNVWQIQGFRFNPIAFLPFFSVQIRFFLPSLVGIDIWGQEFFG